MVMEEEMVVYSEMVDKVVLEAGVVKMEGGVVELD
jgi:hypothetical protein